MKLIFSGVTNSAAKMRSPSFSRSSSSTRITILPALISAMISVVGEIPMAAIVAVTSAGRRLEIERVRPLVGAGRRRCLSARPRCSPGGRAAIPR